MFRGGLAWIKYPKKDMAVILSYSNLTRMCSPSGLGTPRHLVRATSFFTSWKYSFHGMVGQRGGRVGEVLGVAAIELVSGDKYSPAFLSFLRLIFDDFRVH